MTSERDPDRIDPAIELLREVWKSHPDWRLGQMIYNAARADHPISSCPELFDMEDDVLLAGLSEDDQ